MFARIHAIFGAEKYGSSTRPVRCATVSADAGSGAQIDSARRSCHTTAGVSGRPVSRSQARTVSPWLARATAATGNARLRQGFPAGADHGVEQRLRVLLDAAAGQILRPHRDLGDRQDLPGLVDDDGLCARSALVDRQEVVHEQSAVLR